MTTLPPSAPPPIEALPPLPAPGGIPFENAPGPATFFATVKGMLSRPTETIAMQRTGEGVFAALAFFLMIHIPAAFIGQLMSYAIHKVMAGIAPQPPPPPGLPPVLERFIEMNNNPTLSFALLFAIIAVFSGFLFLFINAGLIHLALRLLGGGREGYSSTLKALCYAVTPLAFAIVPFCGSIVGGIWSLVLHFLLVGPAHREPVSKGAMAVLLYYLVILCCGGIAFVTLFFGLFAVASGLKGG